jgi:hypothetical protein
MTTKTTITVTWEEILELIEQKLGTKLKNPVLDIKVSGNYDYGNYSQQLRSITFTEVVEMNITNKHNKNKPLTT